MYCTCLRDVCAFVGELGEAGGLLGVHEPGEDGDGEVDVLHALVENPSLVPVGMGH